VTLSELKDILKSTGLPVVYRAWPEQQAPPLPYICYLCVGNKTIYADASVYFQCAEVHVELYTRMKDPETEATVEAALKDFHWTKSETYIDTERCYQILYEIEV
jgi:hypothetical protein